MPAYSRLVVVDVEATCGRECQTQEIIELPCVVVDAISAEIVASSDIVVRPTKDIMLTPFCVELTGITQADVDVAPDLASALTEFGDFVHWACMDHSFCVVTDGTWDIKTMLLGECGRKGIIPEQYWLRYFDVRTEFAELYYPQNAYPWSLMSMLSDMDMQFDGRRHRGIDDAHNIAKIVCKILRDDMRSRAATSRLPALGSFTAPVLLHRFAQ
jgi:3'-5' exoribonuclease 1